MRGRIRRRGAPISLVALVGWLASAACGRVGYDRADFGALDAERGTDAGADGGSDAGSDAAAPADDGGPDAGEPCAESPCRPVQPVCGCMPGLACHNVGVGGVELACVREGTVPRGGECTRDAECMAGEACLAADTVNGVCVVYCYSDADCPGTPCAALLELGGPLGVCGNTCAPGTGCPVGYACKGAYAARIGSSDSIGLMLCAATGGAADGSTCSGFLVCDEGLFCDGGTCRPLCDPAGVACTGGRSCTVLTPALVIAGAPYGVCR